MDRDPPANSPPAPAPESAGASAGTQPSGATGGRKTRVRGDFATQKDLHLDPITRNLRRAFDEVAAEPLPEEFLELLRQIDETGSTPNGR
ncbi:MAG: NepR family anti-sigma factor [Hyphomonadaceae bacterium]|nr:NepR family anti-sigma factor [Hyphomonadaceae bacterium]